MSKKNHKNLISYHANFDSIKKGDKIFSENIADHLVVVLSTRSKGDMEYWKVKEIGVYSNGEIFAVGKSWDGQMAFKKAMVGEDDIYTAEPSFGIPLGLNLKFYIKKKRRLFNL